MEQVSRSACVLVAALALSNAGAQQPSPAPGLLLPAVDSDVVNVDVFVTGKDHRPVKDLTADEFEVFEDGERVPIVNFVAGLVQQHDAAASTDTEAAPASAPREPPQQELLHFVVYVDNDNLDAIDRRRVLEPLQRFFVGPRPNQNVMVVTNAGGLRVRLPFTQDLESVRAALKQLDKDRTSQRLQADRRSLIDRIERAEDPTEASALMFQVRNYAERAAQQLHDSLATLRGTIDLMGGLPGRKVLLYVSDGLPSSPGRDVLQMLANRFGDQIDDTTPAGGDGGRGAGLFSAFTDLEQGRAFKDVLSHANANRVTLFAIDAAQAQAQFSVSAADGSVDQFGERRLYDATAQAFDASDKSGSLAYLAEYTGGRRLAGNQKLAERLRELSEDLEAGYALAYAPPRGADGKYHKIEVRSKRPGLDLRHREGYRSKTTEERSADMAFSALLGATENPLRIALQTGAPKAAGKDGFTVPLIVKLPVGELQLSHQPGVDVGTLVVYFVVQDLEGGLSAIQKRDLPLRFPTGQVKPGSKQIVAYPVPLLMKAGEYVVGVGVRDELAGRRSGASLRVKVG